MQIGLLALLVVINLLTIQQGYVVLPNEPPHRTLIQYIDNRFQPGDKIWYNMETGALGSDTSDVGIHIRYETHHITLDDFVWDAPYDYEDTASVPRVWIVRPYWLEIPAVAAPALINGRTITDTVAVDAYIIELYEAPAQTDPTVFDNLFTLHVSPLNEAQAHVKPGSEVQINTWWQVAETPRRDFSYTLLVTPQTNPDTVIMQQDAGLESRRNVLDTENILATHSWQTDNTYFSPIFLTLPQQLEKGTYSLWLGVYYWEDGELLEISDSGASAEYESRPLVELLSFEVD